MVLRARTRLAIVGATGCERCPVERIHRVTALGRKRNVQSRCHRGARGKPELGPLIETERAPIAELHHDRAAERGERLLIEGARCGEVLDVDDHVVEHG